MPFQHVAAYEFVLLLLRRPLSSTLFPYTTLFRSWGELPMLVYALKYTTVPPRQEPLGPRITRDSWRGGTVVYLRSEEHTSELQSHHDLVCRLLLEKKKPTRF